MMGLPVDPGIVNLDADYVETKPQMLIMLCTTWLIQLPAVYYGLYVLEEKIKVGKNRVDIDKLRPENTNAPSVTGGYLLSIDKSNPGSPTYLANVKYTVTFSEDVTGVDLADFVLTSTTTGARPRLGSSSMRRRGPWASAIPSSSWPWSRPAVPGS